MTPKAPPQKKPHPKADKPPIRQTKKKIKANTTTKPPRAINVKQQIENTTKPITKNGQNATVANMWITKTQPTHTNKPPPIEKQSDKHAGTHARNQRTVRQKTNSKAPDGTPKKNP
ncbi:hypothetical protein EB14_02261 [Enterococcus faecium]|nr:hypothetical protein [Enterococcus faecium]RBS30818.1 hypothetical protein EB14_02261 [Enterococcus faecium]